VVPRRRRVSARSAATRLRIARAIEYEEAALTVRVPPDGEQATTVRLRRWSHMAADSWYSGDVHVHMHYGGEYVLAPEDAALAQRAEDVHFLNMAVANINSGHVSDEQFFEGKDHALSTPQHILRWGEEYRNDFYGHMCLFGIDELVRPIYAGFLASEHPHDVPTPMRAAVIIGGTLRYAHPMMRAGGYRRVFAVPRAARRRSCRRRPLGRRCGRRHVVSADHMATAALYIASSTGLRRGDRGRGLRGTADSSPSNPPAGVRAFVRVAGEL
jgi:hypothetical protein